MAAFKPPGFADLWWFASAVLHAGTDGQAYLGFLLSPATAPAFDPAVLARLTATKHPFKLHDALLPRSERSAYAGGHLPGGATTPTAIANASSIHAQQLRAAESGDAALQREAWRAFDLHPWTLLFDPLNAWLGSRLGIDPAPPEVVAARVLDLNPRDVLGPRPPGGPTRFDAEVPPELAAAEELSVRAASSGSSGTRAVALILGEDSLKANARIQRARHERRRRGAVPLLIPFEASDDPRLLAGQGATRRAAFQAWSRSALVSKRVEVVSGGRRGQLERIALAERQEWTTLARGVLIETYTGPALAGPPAVRPRT